MTRTAPESRICNAIVKALKQTWPGAVFVFKCHGGPFQMAGLPDLIGCLNGRFFTIEVKRPGDPHPLGPLQSYRLKQIRRVGGIAFVAHSKDEALQSLEEALHD